MIFIAVLSISWPQILQKHIRVHELSKCLHLPGYNQIRVWKCDILLTQVLAKVHIFSGTDRTTSCPNPFLGTHKSCVNVWFNKMNAMFGFLYLYSAAYGYRFHFRFGRYVWYRWLIHDSGRFYPSGKHITMNGNILHADHILMAQCRTEITSLPTHWSYCSLTLSHRYVGLLWLRKTLKANHSISAHVRNVN